ncbi:MAG: DNA polymerase III subunit beta [Dehalococcoidales bacterium]|nr:DNA polymerase III subunit beta [Dehalococcoidales bacterium]
MKLSCLQANLNRGLGIVGRAVATRTTLPITNNVLIATDQSRLKLVATNLEMAISYWTGAKVEEEGTVTVPARLLTEFVNSLPNDNIDISLTPKSKTLNLKCARFEARISGIDSKDFPPIPKVDEGITTRIEIEAFRQAIDHVAFAAATEESRPVLTGVDAQFDKDVLTLAAADGFRLAVYKLPLTAPVSAKAEIIIPARTLAELKRLLPEKDETKPETKDVKTPEGHWVKAPENNDKVVDITVNSTKGQILFRFKTKNEQIAKKLKNLVDQGKITQDQADNDKDLFDNIELVSQLIQGSFPQYGQLIPTSHTTRVVVDVAEFLGATKTASIFARDGSGIVRLMIAPGSGKSGELAISARSEEIGDDEGKIDAVVEGTEAKIAFNGKYLSDVLSVLKESQIALETTSPSSPGVLRPVGTDNYVHVVMPMFVQW